jgi:CMP-N-acetylneuraminic acid synthetase
MFTGLVFMKGHSDRVSGKNLRSFCGRPLCEWILKALAASGYIRQIIVNTDSQEIARTVESLPKVKVHERPAHLLGDEIGANPLIAWDLDHSDGELYVQTHSTNPLLTTATLDRAINMFLSPSEHDSLFSVTEICKRYYWPDGRAINHDPANLIPTQHLAPILEENSCIYLFSKTVFRRRNLRIGETPILFRVPFMEAVDIDEPDDFTLAELLMETRIRKGLV